VADSTSTTRDPETIRNNIRQTRKEMDETVDALSDRLSPGRLMDEAWEALRGNDDAGVGTIIRDHPVPVALIGLGLGWLAVEQSRGATPRRSSNGHVSTTRRSRGRRGPLTGDAVDSTDPDSEHASAGTRIDGTVRAAKDSAGERLSAAGASVADAAGTVRDGVEHAGSAVAEGLSDAGSRASDAVSDASDWTRGRLSDAGETAVDSARNGGRQIRNGVSGMMEDNPMVLGAVAFGLGLASGLAVPSSDVEDRLVGDTAETLKDEAGKLARNQADKVGNVAAEVTHAALDEAERHVEAEDGVPDPDGVREAGRAIGAAAKKAGGEQAQKEGLTPEATQQEAKVAVKRVKAEAQRGSSA